MENFKTASNEKSRFAPILFTLMLILTAFQVNLSLAEGKNQTI